MGCSAISQFKGPSGVRTDHSSTYNQITFYYDDQNNTNLLNSIISAVKSADEANNKYLSKTDTPLSIYLLNEEKYDKKFGDDFVFTRGLYYSINQKIFIKIIEDSEHLTGHETIEDDLRNSAAHEYTHYRFAEEIKKYKLTENEIPIWFNEGYSNYIANDIGKPISPLYPETEYSDEIFKPYHSLVSNEDWQTNGGDNIQVLLTMKEIMKANNEANIRTILKGIQKGQDFNSLLFATSKIDIESQKFQELIKLKMRDFYTKGIIGK
jgi:hypothetical protein